MDGVGHDQRTVIVLAACNRPWKLDEAILPRFDKKVLVPAARKDIFKLNIEEKIEGKLICNVLSEENYRLLAEQTEGYSG